MPAALINNGDMKCHQCATAITEGQNYCGACGHQLKNVCSGCGTLNPPFFKFCGQCGRNLADVGTLLLDRAGLILEADAAALNLLAPQLATVIGKPFALFVQADDLVLFYSHWNAVIGSSRRHHLEVELNPTRDTVVHAQLVLRRLGDQSDDGPRIRMEIGDVTDRRQNLQALQEKRDLIALITHLIEMFRPHSVGLREKTIKSVLEQIGLVAEAQYSFMARIDGVHKRLRTEFQWHASARGKKEAGSPTISFKRLHVILEKLLKGEPYAVGNIEALSARECRILRAWHNLTAGAILCQVIYRRQKPVGVIGLTKATPGDWTRSALLLVKLAGQLMGDALPRARPGRAFIQPAPAASNAKAARLKRRQAPAPIDVEEIEIIIDEEDASPNAGPALERMEVVAGADDGSNQAIRLFAASDGDHQMICPQCGRQEAVAASVFEKMGAVLSVNCPCRCSFRIIREMRHAYRKAVRLEGLFARDANDLNQMAVAHIWGPMVVQNLSKTGLNFTADNAGRLNIGDRVHLRFHLDNSSKSLIKKSAQVKSVRGASVGCQFLNADRYDITLGFYFL